MSSWTAALRSAVPSTREFWLSAQWGTKTTRPFRLSTNRKGRNPNFSRKERMVKWIRFRQEIPNVSIFDIFSVVSHEAVALQNGLPSQSLVTRVYNDERQIVGTE